MGKRVRTMPPNRIWSINQVAAYLGHSEQWFRDNRTILESYGFPKALELNDLVLGWDNEALKLWLDKKSKIVADVKDTSDISARMMERTLNHGRNPV